MTTASATRSVFALSAQTFQLPTAIELDGRTAWFPGSIRGYAPVNSYALVENDELLLVDTGVTVQRDELIEQVSSLLPADARVSVFHTRLGEYNSVCNTEVVIERFPVKTIYGIHNSSRLWFEFRPRAERPNPHDPTPLNDVHVEVVSGSQSLSVGTETSRPVEAFPAPLKLLPGHWLWDAKSRTLMTSDAFSHQWRKSPTGPWHVTEDDDDMTIDEVRDHLLTKFAWLGDADTQPTIDALQDVFDRYDVEAIAPGYGCVLQGRAVVQRHYEMMLTILEDLDRRGVSP